MSLPANDVDIANMALFNIGHTIKIMALADNTTEAKAASLFLDSEREQCLAEFDWRWARKRAVLVEVTGTGDWWNSVDDDWEHVYTLPTDCVQPRELYMGTRNPTPEDREPFDRIRNAADDGYVLVSDVAPVTSGDKAPVLFYTKRATVVTEYPQPFAKFLAWALAVHLAMPVIGGDEGKKQRDIARQGRLLAYIDAWRFDLQSRQPDVAPPSPSLAARGASSKWRRTT
jgi:hypothetical protein